MLVGSFFGLPNWLTQGWWWTVPVRGIGTERPDLDLVREVEPLVWDGNTVMARNCWLTPGRGHTDAFGHGMSPPPSRGHMDSYEVSLAAGDFVELQRKANRAEEAQRNSCYWQERWERAANELTSVRGKIGRLKRDVFRKDTAIREYKERHSELAKAAWDVAMANLEALITVASQEVELQQLRAGRIELASQAQAAIDAYEAECARLRDELNDADTTLNYDEVYIGKQDEKIAQLKEKNQALVAGYDAIDQGLLGVASGVREIIEAGGEF